MNQVRERQNKEPQLKLLRARTKTYGRATFILGLQLLLTVGFPVLGTFLAAIYPEVKAYVGAASLVIVVLDVLVLDRQQKIQLKRGAKIAEQFDCIVLDLPWDQFAVGDKLEPEEIHEAATSFAKRKNDDKLIGWYPEAIEQLPIHLARIVCQRTNLQYDARLRRRYGSILKWLGIILVVLLILVALVQDSTMTAWVLTMAPATPLLTWAAREYYRQQDTATLLETLRKEAKKLWDSAIAGKVDMEVCRARSREFQGAIYAKRSSSPLVMPFLYDIMRSKLEDEMNVGAEDYVKEYLEAQVQALRGEGNVT